MRVRRTARMAGHLAASRVRASAHALRRFRDPAGWARHDPHRVHWVAPSEVVATTAHRLGPDVRGRRLGGDWDRSALPLADLTLWRGIQQRIVEGREWEDTDLAPGRFVAEAPNVGTRFLTDDPARLAAQWRRIDALISSLRSDGWLPHHDIGSTFDREMAIAIGRSGELIRDRGGLHRIIIARLLGLSRVPCRILVEHAEGPAIEIRRRPGA